MYSHVLRLPNLCDSCEIQSASEASFRDPVGADVASGQRQPLEISNFLMEVANAPDVPEVSQNPAGSLESGASERDHRVKNASYLL